MEGRRGAQLRKRLAGAMQAVHQRGNVHITTRELRGVLSYVLFGVRYCEDLHRHPELNPADGNSGEVPGDMAFSPGSPYRQGEVLRELAELDPALNAHPLLDRVLTGNSARDLSAAGPVYPHWKLAPARRQAWLEWLPGEIGAVTGDESALGLAGGQNLRAFRDASMQEDAALNRDLCARLCCGISQLENLPEQALSRANRGRVPLRVPSRTPTETVFWVEKSADRFRLVPEMPPGQTHALTVLPRRLRLIYQCKNGQEEILPLGYALFHVLLNLAHGEQLSELRSDDLFANLQIFTQRVAQEDEQHLLAWSPKEDEAVYRVGIQHRDGVQALTIEAEQL